MTLPSFQPSSPKDTNTCIRIHSLLLCLHFTLSTLPAIARNREQEGQQEQNSSVVKKQEEGKQWRMNLPGRGRLGQAASAPHRRRPSSPTPAIENPNPNGPGTTSPSTPPLVSLRGKGQEDGLLVSGIGGGVRWRWRRGGGDHDVEARGDGRGQRDARSARASKAGRGGESCDAAVQRRRCSARRIGRRSGFNRPPQITDEADAIMPPHPLRSPSRPRSVTPGVGQHLPSIAGCQQAIALSGNHELGAASEQDREKRQQMQRKAGNRQARAEMRGYRFVKRTAMMQGEKLITGSSILTTTQCCQNSL
jgi:hypothetical protein